MTLETILKMENITQEELAKKIKVSQATISRWISGKTKPTFENLIELSKIFDLSYDLIFDCLTEQKLKLNNLFEGLLAFKYEDFKGALIDTLFTFYKQIEIIKYEKGKTDFKDDELTKIIEDFILKERDEFKGGEQDAK